MQGGALALDVVVLALRDDVPQRERHAPRHPPGQQHVRLRVVVEHLFHRPGQLLHEPRERPPVHLPPARAGIPPSGGERPGAEGRGGVRSGVVGWCGAGGGAARAVGGGVGGGDDDDEVRRLPKRMTRVHLGDRSAPLQLE